MSQLSVPNALHVVAAGGGDAHWFLDQLWLVKAPGAVTGDSSTMLESRIPHGSGAPLHRHTREQESFYVLEGEITAHVGDETAELSAGAFVHLPMGVPHSFVVESSFARMLVSATPAGFEDFVREAGQPAATLTLPTLAAPPDLEHLGRVAAAHGIELLGPPPAPRGARDRS